MNNGFLQPRFHARMLKRGEEVAAQFVLSARRLPQIYRGTPVHLI